MKSSKGQYLSAEQMMLFSLGIVITISVYLSFTNISANVDETITSDTLQEVGNSVASAVSNVRSVANYSDPSVDYVNMSIDIPQRISEEAYKIKTSEDKIIVIQGSNNETVELPESGIDIFGEVQSARGRIKIVFSKGRGNIMLERWRNETLT